MSTEFKSKLPERHVALSAHFPDDLGHKYIYISKYQYFSRYKILKKTTCEQKTHPENLCTYSQKSTSDAPHSTHSIVLEPNRPLLTASQSSTIESARKYSRNFACASGPPTFDFVQSRTWQHKGCSTLREASLRRERTSTVIERKRP